MSEYAFVSVTGFILGMLIITIISGIFKITLKTLVKLIWNSLIGLAFIHISNFLFSKSGIYINPSPIISFFIGITGIPGYLCLLAFIFML